MACVVILAPLFGAGTADFSLERGFRYMASLGKPLPAWTPHSLLPLLCLLLVQAVFAAPISFGEEFGWRGYLQLRLFPNNPVLSAVGTGVIWGYGISRLRYAATAIRTIQLSAHCLCTPFSESSCPSFSAGWYRRPEASGHLVLRTRQPMSLEGQLSILLFGGAANFLFASTAGLLGLISLGAMSAWIVFTGQLKPAVQASNESARTAQAS